MSDKHTIDVGHVVARLLAVKLHMGLVIDELLIEGEDLHLERHPFSVSLPKPGTLEVRLSEASLAGFLNSKAPSGISNFKVRLHEGKIYVQATAKMFLEVTVSAVCSLRIEDGKQLFVDLETVDGIAGAGIKGLIQKQIDGINPVLDVEDLPVDATLTGVQVANSMVSLHGTISPR